MVYYSLSTVLEKRDHFPYGAYILLREDRQQTKSVINKIHNSQNNMKFCMKK